MLRTLILLFASLFLFGCSSANIDIPKTVEAQVASTSQAISIYETQVMTAVEETLTAIPTVVKLPTQTPQSTYTPFPTLEPLPTYTPYPTYTPKAIDIPSPTSTNTPEATREATRANVIPTVQPAISQKSELLRDMRNLKRNIELLANDNPGIIFCSRTSDISVANNYEAIINYPSYDVTSSPTIQDPYNRYRQAIEMIRATNKDLYQFCIDYLNGTNTSDLIPFQIWAPARQGVNRALEILNPGITYLENN